LTWLAELSLRGGDSSWWPCRGYFTLLLFQRWARLRHWLQLLGCFTLPLSHLLGCFTLGKLRNGLQLLRVLEL